MDDSFDDLSIFDMFRMEAEEQVDAMQSLLLGLREGEPDEKTLRSLMRGAHSLKGAARIVGLPGAVHLTHAMEDRFVAAQEGAHLNTSDVDAMLAANDLLRSLAALGENEAEAWLAQKASAIEKIVTQLGDGQSTASTSAVLDPADTRNEAEASSPGLQEPTGRESAEPAAQGNLRITAQRFDQILGTASDMLVKAQTVVRLRERMQKTTEATGALLSRLSEQRQRTPVEMEALASLLQTQADTQSLLVDLERATSESERTAEELHHDILQARLRPFGEIVPGLRRLIRDLSAEMGKRVRVEITGERTAAGKSPEGTVRILARHENGRLAITLSDDGCGVNAAAVLKRAQERNLVSASVGSRLAEHEILEFLFLPGFSTRDVVTEISGRGFGLDVVQSLVHEVGGAVRIENRAGEGTTFHLTLPVTRSLMRVLIVEGEGETYAVPLVRIARVAQGTIVLGEDGRATAIYAGRTASVLPLIDVLGGGGGATPPGPALLLCLLDTNGSESGLVLSMDRVVGDATVAVRQLSVRFGKMAGIAAVTLTEQGAPLLIIDPDSLLRSAVKLQQQRSHSAAAPAQSSRGRVLVVDDSPTVRQMLRRTLLRAGYAITTAEHGAEGWGLLQVEQFHLLVSDVDMPEMNGIELVEHVRLNARIGSMPIVLLSYKGREQDRQRGLDAGADAYVTKGEFEEKSFLQLVEDLIGPAHLPIESAVVHDGSHGEQSA